MYVYTYIYVCMYMFILQQAKGLNYVGVNAMGTKKREKHFKGKSIKIVSKSSRGKRQMTPCF